MNNEAKNLLLAAMDTGCGLKELCGVRKSDIHLNIKEPYIMITTHEGRNLKTRNRYRKIPLIGYALTAFQNYPASFINFQNSAGPDRASAAIMKFLKNNNLLESENHSIYSIRHTFADRLRNLDLPNDVISKVMGHYNPSQTAHYGHGWSFEKIYNKLKLLEKDWH